jgi:hypothetical protein
MADEGKKLLDKRFKPDGYNVGINVGTDASETDEHRTRSRARTRIPRRSGDTVNPRGGVRG